MAGKGDKYRPVDRKKWEKAWKHYEAAQKRKNKDRKGAVK